jgi:hypothetical protein
LRIASDDAIAYPKNYPDANTSCYIQNFTSPMHHQTRSPKTKKGKL